MGKIYYYSAIAQRTVPKPNDFTVAKYQVLDDLTQLAERGGIWGAKVFGSVAKGTPYERSDFDLLVVTEEDSSLQVLRDIFEEVKQTTRVEIEPIVVSRTFSERGFHSIDDLFLDHIRSIPNEGNIAGSDPLTVVKPFNLPSTKVHEQYLAQKLRRLREGVFTYSEADRYKVLRRALEGPINVGRRTLQVLPYFGYPMELQDDGKQEVIRRFRETFGGTSLQSGFDSLLEQDRDYTAFLREAIQGRVDMYEYEARLQSMIRDCIPQAITWTSDISLMYSDLLEGNARHKEGNSHYSMGKEHYL